MNKKNKDIYVNYLLTLGFILLIVTFLVTIISISRFVLSDSNSFTKHLKDTQNLLKNIDEVNKDKNLSKNINQFDSNININNLYKLKVNNDRIIDYSDYNINQNKSIISFRINSDIKTYKNIYYIQIENKSKLKKRQIITYTIDDSSNIRIGEFLEYKNQINNNNKKSDYINKTFVILDINTKKIINIQNQNQIKGILFYLKKTNQTVYK